MTTAELAALARSRLTLIHKGRNDLPPESAEDHVRNALQVLAGLRVHNPALWAICPELGRAERRARSGLAILVCPGGRPLATRHLYRAVEALCASEIDWTVVTDVHATCALLLRAFYTGATVAPVTVL